MHALLLAIALVQAPAPVAAQNGVVTGRVLAVDGTPAVNIRVTATVAPLGLFLVEPAADTAIASLTQTDSAGRYRLENIPPGRYYIAAGLLDLPTYFPGTTAAVTATAVSVGAGSTTENIDFSMLKGTGAKVSGRLAVMPTIKRSTPGSVTLFGATPPAFETVLREDGTFEFPTVRSGTYSLRTSMGIASSTPIVVEDKDLMIVVGEDTVGIRIIGKVVMSSSASGAQLANRSVMLGPTPGASTSGGSYSTMTNNDGTFEFLRIPPGVYSMRVALDRRTETLVVADKDLSGIELPVNFLAEIPGRLTVEEGVTAQQWSVEVRGTSGVSGAPVGPGVFTLRLAEGSHQVSVRLTLGYIVRSITYGDVDLTKSSLEIIAGEPVKEIRITVGKVPMDAVEGVRVSGRVFGLRGSESTSARVALRPRGSRGSTVEASLNADGTFAFPKVQTGTYTAELMGVPYIAVTPSSSQIFVQEPVSGLQFSVSPTIQVKARLSVVGVNGAGSPPPDGVQAQFRNSESGWTTSFQPGGLLAITLVEGEYTISVERLPQGYTVSSITEGSVDLRKSRLKINGAQTPEEIQIILSK